jgi:hypothetical protein
MYNHKHKKYGKILAGLKMNTRKSVLNAKGGTLVEAGKHSDKVLGKAYAVNTKRYGKMLPGRY